MIIDMPNTTTGQISRKLVELRASGGAVTLGRVLTLVVPVNETEFTETFIDAANDASREHPCRVIVAVRGDAAGDGRLDAQIRVGGDAGASEVVVLRLSGGLADHAASAVTPFLLPDTPIVVWWPEDAPEDPRRSPLGRLGIRRITNASNAADPVAELRHRLERYAPGDTDLAWSQITLWRALLAATLDQPPYPQIVGAHVAGPDDDPALALAAGWLAAETGAQVRRLSGEISIGVDFADGGSASVTRPDGETMATVRRTGFPDAQVPLARRSTAECLAEELRRLDADDVYAAALRGIESVVSA